MRQQRGKSLVAHAGKILLKTYRSPPWHVLRARGDAAGGTEWFPTEPFYHRYDVCESSATGAGTEKKNPLYVCFIDLTKAHNSVDRTLLWAVVARYGVPQNMISVVRRFHDGLRACVQLNDRVFSGWFAVERSLCQGFVLAPFLVNISPSQRL